MNATIIENDNTNAIMIFSVYQTGLEDSENACNHNTVLAQLSALGINYKTLQGQYTHDNGEVVQEPSILIEDFDREILVNQICTKYNQESYLYSDNKRNSVLIYVNSSNTVNLGILSSVTRLEAMSSEAFSYCPRTEQYFICK